MKRMFKPFKWMLLVPIAVGLMLNCGKAPSDVPAPQLGTIRISAQIDTTLVDSMDVILDNIPRGQFANPCTFEGIEAGRHQVAVSKEDQSSSIDFSASPQRVSVHPDAIADVVFALTKFAPDFTLKNLDDEDISLANYRGKVALLVFYIHT